MSVCKIEEGDAGHSVPRTCPTCKLSGTCHKGLDRKSQADEIARLRADNQVAIANVKRLIELLKNAVAETSRLRAELSEERDESMWRFWSDKANKLAIKNAQLNKELDAVKAERDKAERYKNLNWLDRIKAEGERDAAQAAVTFVRNVAQSAMTAEHDQDERECLLDLDTLRFQRDCDITAARDIRAMIEQEGKG